MRADECREMKIGDCSGGGKGWLKLFAWLVQLPVVYQTIIYQGCAAQQEHLLSLSEVWGSITQAYPLAGGENNPDDSHWEQEEQAEQQQLLHAANSFMSDAKRF